MLTLFRKLMGRSQRGQVVVVAVGVMVLGLCAIMISVDVGWWLRDKRDAQNDADAIALAAVQEIGDPSQRVQAVAVGLDWADFNGVDTSEVVAPDCTDGVLQSNFCFIDRDDPPDGIDDMVRVKVSRPSNSFIAEALGVGTPTLNPPAAAAKIRAYGACVLPWAIDAVEPYEDPEAFEQVWGVLGDPPNPQQLFVFQLSPGGGFASDAPGNFGALGVYGANANDYTDTIENECGSQGQSACNSDTQVVTPDDPTLDCDIQTGNLGANTDKSLSLRMERPEYGEVFPYADCDASSYADAVEKADSCLGRLVVLAIIKDFPSSGSGIIEIYGIANFYIAGWDRCAPYNDSDDCGDPKPADSGIAWGYLLLEVIGGTPAWQFDFSQSSSNPFAPVIVALVE